MRTLCSLLLAGTLIAGAAFAQGGWPGDRDRGRRGDYRGPREGGGMIVDRAISDLNSGAWYRYADRYQRKCRDHAIEALYKFRERWARGRWDGGQLDKAIGNIDHLLRSSWGSGGGDRSALERDLMELRDFRARGYPR